MGMIDEIIAEKDRNEAEANLAREVAKTYRTVRYALYAVGGTWIIACIAIIIHRHS